MTLASLKSGQRLGALDFALNAIGSCLAVYSAGMSIESPEIGYFCAGFILIGTLFSYMIRGFGGGSPWLRADGFLYAIAAICSGVFMRELNAMLPGGGFPAQMGAAGTLCWMIVFGSFLSWRDSTIMFQAVPAIALFGLVGCYDTYRNVVFAFFGFLMCLCTGFARAHGREMLRLAAASGYFDRAGIGFDASEPEQSVELYETVKRGPWRWVAGPEWALASALAIVLISLLGAPVIQSSVQSVAGFARIRPPTFRRRTTPTVQPGEDASGTTNIGQGPLKGFTGQTILEAKLDKVRYLRAHTFDLYTGSGWSQSRDSTPNNATDTEALAVQEVANPIEIPFEITTRIVERGVPIPATANPSSISNQRVTLQADQGYASSDALEPGSSVSGSFIQPHDLNEVKDAPHPAPPLLDRYLSQENISPAVATLARDTINSLRVQSKPGSVLHDRQIADAFMDVIAEHARYNSQAPPIGAGEDAVETFLFRQHQGYCDLFASSMVLLARSAGIPARYVTGYLPDPDDSVGSLYVARDRDYHAWAELYFQNAGWVIYDPTEKASVVPGSQSGNNGSQPWFRSPWLVAILNTACGLMLAGAVFSWLSTRRKKGRNPEGRRSDVQRAYVAYSRLLRGTTGRRRMMNETPSEYLEATKTFLNGSYEIAEKLTRDFEVALYASRDVEEMRVFQIETDLRRLRAELKKQPRPDRKSGKTAE